MKPISSISALKALVPSTLMQLPGAGVKSFKALSKLVQQVPTYQVNLGSDLAQTPKVILELLSKQYS